MSTTTAVPVSKKVWVGFLAALVATVIQAVIPGYTPDPTVAALITAVVGYAASFLVKEEKKYLQPALANADK